MEKLKTKEFMRAFARNAFYFLRALFRFMPYCVVKAMTNGIIAVAFQLVKSKRDVAMESLDIAFGESITVQEKKRIIKECFSTLGRSMVELLYFADHPKLIEHKAFFENFHYLQDVLKEGKGAILVSGHIGNFPLMLLRLVQEGVPTSVILRSARDEIIEKDFEKLRSENGLKSIYSMPRAACVTATLRALRKNECVFIPCDQNFGTKGGVFIDFFGRKAATPTGAAVFAMRTGAPIVPIFTHRYKDDVHKVIVEKPFYLETKLSDDEAIYNCMEKITRMIEADIRRYPSEWGWFHRRWKTQPRNAKEQDNEI